MIQELQEAMSHLPQVDIETNHTFCEGIYAREIIIPADVAIIGAKHKTSFLIVISKGRCSINGTIYEAPHTMISLVGAKRAIFAFTETVLTTFHATTETDIKKIESAIIDEEDLHLLSNSGGLLE